MKKLPVLAALGAALVLLVTGCGTSGEQAVVTEVVWTDSNGNVVPGPSGAAPGGTTQSQAPATPEVQRTAVTQFQTPDGLVLCGAGPLAGMWGGIEGSGAALTMGCMGSDSSIPRPAAIPGCGQGPGKFGGAAALGDGWVMRTLCTGGTPFNSQNFTSATVGDTLSVNGVDCDITASDAVTCSLGGESFSLSRTSLSVTGNDRTQGN